MIPNKPLSTVLYADDDADDAILLRQSAQQRGAGLDIHHVTDGDQAINFLETAKTGSGLPQVILLDLNMPRRDGRQTLSYIKSDKDLSSIPVVIFSTSENPLDREFCKIKGAASYIRKPEHFHGYRAVVETLLSFIPQTP